MGYTKKLAFMRVGGVLQGRLCTAGLHPDPSFPFLPPFIRIYQQSDVREIKAGSDSGRQMLKFHALPGIGAHTVADP